MELLEKMYRGKIGYFGEIRVKSEDYAKAVKKALQAENMLTEKFPEIEKLFEEYQSAHSEVVSIVEYEKFALGFRVGAQLMLEMFKPLE